MELASHFSCGLYPVLSQYALLTADIFMVVSKSDLDLLQQHGRKRNGLQIWRVKVKVKVKVRFTLEQATKDQRGRRCITLLFH